MAGNLYCGRCHRWLDDRSPAERGDNVCHCFNPDLGKDPNCHNPNHEHHDPQSPIMLRRKAEYEAEEARGRERKATVADSQPVFSETLDVEEEGLCEEAIREDALTDGHPYHVAVFNSTTGKLLARRPLREPKIDEETRAALDAILRETNEQAED